MSGLQLALALPDEVVEVIARRVAEILGDRIESDPADGYLDVTGAARFLACPKSRIYDLTRRNELPHHRDGSRLLFDPAELRAYVEGGGAFRRNEPKAGK